MAQPQPESRDAAIEPVLEAAFLERKKAMIASHLEHVVVHEPWVQTVEYDATIPRWYVRFGCDGRDAATIYFDLHQRTLRYECYFLPDPPAFHEDLYRYLLRRNHDTYTAHFSIGPDGDLYITGRTLLEHLNEDELDRIIGVIYELVENWFQPVLDLTFRRPREQ